MTVPDGTADPIRSGHEADELLADLNAWMQPGLRLRYARHAALLDQFLMGAHTLLNNGTVYDSQANWADLARLANRVSDLVDGVVQSAAAMAVLAARETGTPTQ